MRRTTFQLQNLKLTQDQEPIKTFKTKSFLRKFNLIAKWTTTRLWTLTIESKTLPMKLWSLSLDLKAATWEEQFKSRTMSMICFSNLTIIQTPILNGFISEFKILERIGHILSISRIFKNQTLFTTMECCLWCTLEKRPKKLGTDGIETEIMCAITKTTKRRRTKKVRATTIACLLTSDFDMTLMRSM